MQRLRKIASLTALLSFLLLAVTGVVLFIMPQGRVAYWAGWRLWGLDKSQWGDLHNNLAVLALVSIGLHIYFNWGRLISYLRDRLRRIRIFTPSFSIAALVTALFVAGTLRSWPPFNLLADLNRHFKQSAAAKFGSPPYGHAELSSLETFCRRMGLDLEAAVAALSRAGFHIEDPSHTLLRLARDNRATPQDLYQAMGAPPPRRGGGGRGKGSGQGRGRGRHR
jgi:hypothetical protein